MGDWYTGQIGDLFDLVPGFAFKSRDFCPSGVPVIKIKNIKAGYFSSHDLSFVDERFLKERPEKVARFDDLLITMSGNRHDGSPDTWVGKVAPFRRGENFLINQRVGALRLKSAVKADARYFGFLLSSWPFQNLFISIATSSGGQANLSPQQILTAPIRYPDLKTQQRLSELLGALDDKIELNRRMNATLEEMARAIFKDWFVDFGPVRAKTEGREPYLNRKIWELFPDHLDVDGNPEGWNERPLSSFLDIIGGGTPKTSIADYWGGDIPWFSVVDTPPEGNVFVIYTNSQLTREALNKSSARLVPEGTTIISARGTVGNLAMAGQEMAFNQSCYGLRGQGDIGDYFVYLAAERMVGRLNQMAHGSVFSTITRATFENVSFALADGKILREFENSVGPLFSRVKSNVVENRTLAAIRDLLLPRLMSGEITIKDAEKEAAEAV